MPFERHPFGVTKMVPVIPFKAPIAAIACLIQQEVHTPKVVSFIVRLNHVHVGNIEVVAGLFRALFGIGSRPWLSCDTDCSHLGCQPLLTLSWFGPARTAGMGLLLGQSDLQEYVTPQQQDSDNDVCFAGAHRRW